MKKLYFIFLFCLSVTTSFTQNQSFDVERISAEVTPHLVEKSVSGKIDLTFKALQDTDSVFLDAINMKAELLGSNNQISLKTSSTKIWLLGSFKKANTYQIQFRYTTQPRKALYFVGFDDDTPRNDQIFTQGQGKYTSNWLPSIDNMQDKIEFDISVVIPKYYGAIANGKLIEQWDVNDSLSRWVYDMQKPMSSYLVAFSVGDYIRDIEYSDSGVELHKYILKQDSSRIEPTYRHTKRIFNYLEQKIGVPYPWQNYKQVPVRDFLYAGMENTSLTIFSDTFVTDSIGFNDRNYVNVNAHELAHQWFGNLVTETNSKHHWLHEGFATYYALLAEREIFGENYFYHRLYESAESLKRLSDQGKGEKLVAPKGSSLTYYQKGAWALFILNKLVGVEVFDKAVKNYLNKYAYKNVETADFMNEVKALTDVDLSTFESDWLYQTSFKAEQALAALQDALFIKPYFELIAKRPLDVSSKVKDLEKAFEFPINEYIAQEAVIQLPSANLSVEDIQLYKKAFQSNNTAVRQAISFHLQNIPKLLQHIYETLLDDDSYQTRENALYALWMSFPEKRANYLEQTKNLTGFNDHNIRLLWLTLNLATPDFDKENTSQTLSTLIDYTSSKHRFQTRQHAFGYLYQINAFSEDSIRNLLEACFHHTWRFRDYCRQLLKTLAKDTYLKNTINTEKQKLSPKQIGVIDKLL
jgi:aminopeptidase N